MERSLAVFLCPDLLRFCPARRRCFDPTTQQVTASLPTLSSSFYPSYYVLPPPSRSSLSVTSISPAQLLRAPPFHLLPLTSHQLPSPPTSFLQNASSPLTNSSPLSNLPYCSSVSISTNQLLPHCLSLRHYIQLCYSTIYLLCTPY